MAGALARADRSDGVKDVFERDSLSTFILQPDIGVKGKNEATLQKSDPNHRVRKEAS
jgi:hypothetical protein